MRPAALDRRHAPPRRPSRGFPRGSTLRGSGTLRTPAAASSAASAASAGGYAVGDRVRHATFGAGVIRRIEQLNGDQKLVVEFDSAGVKTLLAKFAKLTKLG